MRDRVGEKPLYFGMVNSSFVFASELESMKKVRGFTNRMNQGVLSMYFQYGYVPAPYSIYENIYKYTSIYRYTYTMYIHRHTHIYIHAHKHLHIHIHIDIHVHIHTHTRIDVPIHKHTNMRKHKHTNIYLYIKTDR